MNRDLVCVLRLVFDSIPKPIRNSKFIFILTKLFFKLPDELFMFRHNYSSNKITDLKSYYTNGKGKSLKRISPTTDINSKHLNILKKFIIDLKPNSIIDVGCGSGFLISLLNNEISDCAFHGIDFNIENYDETIYLAKDNSINFESCTIEKKLDEIKDGNYNVVVCSHVLEHIKNPEKILSELRRIASDYIIIICPMEKPYKWGMNYHINFFPTIHEFIKLIESDILLRLSFKIFLRLGDIMYIEKR